MFDQKAYGKAYCQDHKTEIDQRNRMPCLVTEIGGFDCHRK